MATIKQTIQKLIVLPLKVYQLLISPLLGQRCRFYPSCSHYTEEAIASYGVFKGLYLSVRRLLRCHPFHPGGVDEVPPQQQKRDL